MTHIDNRSDKGSRDRDAMKTTWDFCAAEGPRLRAINLPGAAERRLDETEQERWTLNGWTLIGSNDDRGIAPIRLSGEDDDDGMGGGGAPGTGLVTKTKPKTKKPSLYKVLMLNDDYTPMEFVVSVLEQFFHKSHDEAVTIMLTVHQRGVAVCGVYTYEVAETKVTSVMDFARRHQHPLQCTMEKE